MVSFQVKMLRDMLLVQSDWIALADAPVSSEKKAEWFVYRQALRDVPQNYPNAQVESDVVWPVKPA